MEVSRRGSELSGSAPPKPHAHLHGLLRRRVVRAALRGSGAGLGGAVEGSADKNHRSQEAPDSMARVVHMRVDDLRPAARVPRSVRERGWC